MKRITIQILLTLTLLGNCFGLDTFLRYSGGGLVVVDGVIQIGSAPVDDSDLILQYLMGANGSESTLTENTAPTGTNYNGTVSGATWN